MAKSQFNGSLKRALGECLDESADSTWIAKLFKLRQQHCEQNGRRLDDEAGPPRDLSPEMTLREFFDAYAWPLCLSVKGDSERTRRDYFSSLRHWAAITGDPALGNIAKQHLANFVAKPGFTLPQTRQWIQALPQFAQAMPKMNGFDPAE